MKLKKKTRSKGKFDKDSISLILPVYNEFKTIESVLQDWENELSKHSIEFYIIVCEDGSTDGTSDLLKKLQNKYRLILNQKMFRRGYGSAVIDGILSVKTEYILSIDSDGQCDPKNFSIFWKKRNNADVLIGNRIVRSDPEQRKLFSFLFKLFFKCLFPTPIHDPSAPFVLYKKAQIVPYISYLQLLNEGFWWGFIGTCVKNHLSVIEIPINHRKRKYGETQVYKINKLPSIIIRNLHGLIKLKLAR